MKVSIFKFPVCISRKPTFDEVWAAVEKELSDRIDCHLSTYTLHRDELKRIVDVAFYHGGIRCGLCASPGCQGGCFYG